MHSDSDKYTVRLWGHILLRGGIFAHLCGQIWLKLIDIHERTSMLTVKHVKIVYDTIHCEVFKQLGVNSRLCGGKSWERVNAATLRLWRGARRIKSTHTKIGLRCWLWILCRVEDVAWQRLKPPLSVSARGATDFNLSGTRSKDEVYSSSYEGRPCNKLNHSGLGL